MNRICRFSFATITILTTVFIQTMTAPQNTYAVTASDWESGYIIDDTRFTNSSAMSVSQIQGWLDTRLSNCDPNGTQTSELSGGIDYNGDGNVTRAEYGKTYGNPAPFTCLNNYYEVPKTSPGSTIPASNYGSATIPSGAKSAAQLIYDAGKAYNISPKVLLVKLGTESAGPLTSDPWPFKSQYTYAMGAHCPDSGPGGSANCDTDYAGFSLQMREAAKLLRWYLDNMSESWWSYKKPYTSNYILWNVQESGCGGKNVFIQSKATAALYTYTPYQPNSAALSNMYGIGDGCSAYGNRNFWRVYNDWFGPTTSAITSYLSTCSGEKYLIETSAWKKRLVSDAVASEWGLSGDSFAYTSYGCERSTYDLALGNLVRSRQTNRVYLINDGKAYYINNQQTADAWGLGSIANLPLVDGSTVHNYLSDIDKLGLTNVITSDNPSVTKYYLVLDGQRYTINGTDTGNDDVLRLISGDTIINRNVIPVELIQTIPSGGSLDYHFTVGGDLYVFDFGKIRKIESTPIETILARETLAPIALNSNILNIYSDQGILSDAFFRDGYYYHATSEGGLEKTLSADVLGDITNTQPEIITRLLTSRLIANSLGVSEYKQMDGNVRLISCSNQQYLVERYIRKKRSLSAYSIANWSLSSYHFFKNDPGCAYETFDVGMGKTIRSRTTGKVYQVVGSIAYLIDSQAHADHYELGDYRYSTYPMMEGKSINERLTVRSVSVSQLP